MGDSISRSAGPIRSAIGTIGLVGVLGCSGQVGGSDPGLGTAASVPAASDNTVTSTSTTGTPGGGQDSVGQAASTTSSGTGGAASVTPGIGGGAAVSAGGAVTTDGMLIGAGGAGVIDEVPQPCTTLTDRRLRRLSAREIAAVISDLVGPQFEAEILDTLPFEPRLGGFDNQSSALFVSPSFQEATAALAESVAFALDTAALAPCATPEGSDECLNNFVTAFATKAYGRPPTAEEVTRITTAAATGEDYATSVRLVVEVVLQSPYFLYVSELGAPEAVANPGQPVALTPHETASQLSFLLMGSRPDEQLLAAASSGTLATPAEIQAQAERLLAQPRATEQLTRFITGWLDMGPIADAPKNPDVFPELTETIVTAMQQEYDSFIRTRLTSGQGTLTEFMTAQSSDIPAALQPVYGADYDPATGLNPAQRSGVLSLPGLLTYHSADQHSGPVERGLFVRRQLLCQTVPPPPQTVLDQIAEDPIDFEDGVQTTRQKYEVHVNEASCAACHLLFDPIGFGLEQMDGMGRFRTTENGLPVDSTGELSGTDVDGVFEGVTELSQKLGQSQLFQACMVEHFFRFSMSRPAETADACVVDAWTSEFSTGGGKINDLVLAYVSDPVFNQRQDDR